MQGRVPSCAHVPKAEIVLLGSSGKTGARKGPAKPFRRHVSLVAHPVGRQANPLSPKMLDRKQRKRENITTMEPKKRCLSPPNSDTHSDWREIAVAIPIVASTWLLGPLLLCCAFLQRWAAHSAWKAGDRWGSIRLLTWAPLLYLPIFLFHEPLSTFWQAHLPGNLDIWPPTFDGWLLRAVLALLLVPAGTLLLERIQPRTIPVRYMRRQPRPGEVVKTTEDEEAVFPPLPLTPSEHHQNPPAGQKTETRPATQTAAREKKERDPRPLVESLAEERGRREQEKRNAIQQQASKTTIERSVDSIDDDEEHQGPDPFKKKPIDWSRRKE